MLAPPGSKGDNVNDLGRIFELKDFHLILGTDNPFANCPWWAGDQVEKKGEKDLLEVFTGPLGFGTHLRNTTKT